MRTIFLRHLFLQYNSLTSENYLYLAYYAKPMIPSLIFSLNPLLRRIPICKFYFPTSNHVSQKQFERLIIKIQRNAAQQCGQHNRLELSAWRDETGAKAAESFSQDMIATAMEKAKQEMSNRKKLEYMLWETSKSMHF